jgi:DNA-binding phage protein
MKCGQRLWRRGGGIPQAVEIAAYGEELVRLVLHPESKMLGPDGRLCKAETKGLLTPRLVRVAAVHLLGKEGNKLEEVAIGEVIEPDEVLVDAGDDAWECLVVPAARAMGIRRLARETGLARSKLTELFTGRAMPRCSTRDVVTAVVTHWATTERIET